VTPPECANRTPSFGWTGGLEECTWDEIHRPGCYVFTDTGDLVRVPPEGLTGSSTPVISVISREPRRLARVSYNVAEAVQVLRAITEENGYRVNF
jgi:hypothetical protein